MNKLIWIAGDIHGNFHHIAETLIRTKETPIAVILLGDLECAKTFSECIKQVEELGVPTYFIPGNHDTDSAESFLNLWGDPLFDKRNLHARVTEIAGFRIAGLGGVFRQSIWNPEDESMPPVRNWSAFVEVQNHLRPASLRVDHPTPERIAGDPLLRMHASTIFHEDWFNLYGLPADILVTHEAPDYHRDGYSAITALAQSMRVKSLFHGHHHEHHRYLGAGEKLGFQPYGVGFCEIVDQYGAVLSISGGSRPRGSR